MPKRYVFMLAMLGAALASGGAFAQCMVPGVGQLGEGSSNNLFPYDTNSARNMAYMQFHAPGEFCTNPPDSWNGGTTPGSGCLEPAMIGGLSVRPDNFFAQIFTATHTRPDTGTFHFMTDMQANGNLIFFQDSINWNATTVTYPGGFTLSYPTGSNPSIPGTQNFTPITSTVGQFIYLGTLTGCCGSCPGPSQGGFLINVRVITGSGTGLLISDMESRFFAVGIHYNVIRMWGVGAGSSGFTNWANYFAGLVYSLEAGGCKTYNDLYDEIINAVITGNPPSDGIPVSDPLNETDPLVLKNDPGIGGLRNSFWKKAINSEAAYNRGRFNSAGNTLDALTHHIDAQDGKHLDTDSAQDLRNCVRSLKSSLAL
jgi:hypothetical protein